MDDQQFVFDFLHSDAYHCRILDIAERFYHNILDERCDNTSLDAESHLAKIFARSKLSLRELRSETIKVGVVFAMWREADRIRPFTNSNQAGENAILRKVRSLEWLFSNSNIEWCIYAVDDGCPDNSYDVAREIAAENNFQDKVKIYHLRDFVERGIYPLNSLKSTKDSMKGGSIIAGCLEALSDDCTHICYTDADNTVDLAQIGHFIYEISSNNAAGVLGDRFRDTTYKLWWDKRRQAEPAFFTHVRRLLTLDIFPTKDIPCALKMFSAEALSRSISGMTTFDFSFDFDLLCQFLDDLSSLHIVDCVAVDSFENSTWHSVSNDEVNYRKIIGPAHILKNIKYEPKRDIANFVIEEMSHPSIITAIQQSEVPMELSDCVRQDIGNIDLMPLSSMTKYLRSLPKTIPTSPPKRD